MKLIELFSGTESISKVFRERKWDTFTIDNDKQFNPDLCADILEINLNSLIPIKPDVIWASPPCTTFSVASIGHHWNTDHTPKTKEAELGIKIILKTTEIIEALSPRYWYIENPRGKLRKLDLINGIRHTVTYCQYGDSRMKPTDIWTNNFNWQPKKMCKNGMPCHVSAPRGSKTGTQGLDNAIQRGIIPKKLCEEIELISH